MSTNDKLSEADMKHLVEIICEADCYGKFEVENPYHPPEPEYRWYADKAKELGVECK